jgi:class 3 adenylate cyclase
VPDIPGTSYAVGRDGARIAYQVTGAGSIDLVYVPNWASPIDLIWDHPMFASFLGRLASFSRLVLFDKRGSGSSDHVAFDALATLEDWADDMVTVMDAAGSERAAVVGAMVGAPIALLFAATHPERTASLVVVNASPRALADDAYPGLPFTEVERRLEAFQAGWGTEPMVEFFAPSMARDPAFRRWFARFCRVGNPPAMATAVYRAQLLADVRPVLPVIQAPTLVVSRGDDATGLHSRAHSRYLAEHIPGSRLVEVPGDEFLVYAGDAAAILNEIEAFLTGERPSAEPDRVLATVMFADIASSTELAAAIGDRAWRELLERFRGLVREQLDRFHGREVNTRGDDFLATFDGPARAIRCASAIVAASKALGFDVRAGIHTGEVELMAGDLGGIAVHIGARVSELARPGEVLLSRTVVDLVTGSGIEFIDRGEHQLKGVHGSWKLFAVID